MNLNVNDKHLHRLIAEITPEKLNKEIRRIEYIGGGSFGKVYGVSMADGTKIAVKAFREKGALQKESGQLGVLSMHTKVQMPEVLFVYEGNESALMGMTFIDGKNVLNPLFIFKSRRQKEKFSNDVADAMLEWHSVKAEKYGYTDNPQYDSWKDFYIEEKQKPILDGLSSLADKGKYSKKNLALLKAATKIYNSLPDESQAPVLIHGDLNIMNIMADPKTLELIGIIDPIGSIYADKEYDLFQLRNMWGDAFGLYNTYKLKSNLSEYVDFRIAYYGAMNEASCRLGGGLIMPLWEILCNNRLKKEMKKIRRRCDL